MAAFTSVSVNRLEGLVLGAASQARGPVAREAPVEIEVLDVLDVGDLRPPLLRPVRVDVGVGQDPVEPRLEIRPPSSKLAKARYALRYVSCTRSSASDGLRVIRSAAVYRAGMYSIARSENIA
jgi:hypothetical protein